jgi:hypothetical protein
MSKKKNTLKDLDEFLKQQAATLVTPATLSEPQEQPRKSEPAAEEPKVSVHATPKAEELSFSEIANGLQVLSQKHGEAFKPKFYDLIITTLESKSNSSPEDKMLINTALYLKHGANWKEAIRAYWKAKP